jgi:general stress protein YciG
VHHGYHSAIAQQQNTTEEIGRDGGDAQGGNATTIEGGGNLSTSEIRTNLEQARTALQNNDTQTAMMYLDLTLEGIGGG